MPTYHRHVDPKELPKEEFPLKKYKKPIKPQEEESKSPPLTETNKKKEVKNAN